MKKILLISFLIFFKQTAFSQWTSLNTGVSDNLYSVYFVNSTLGFAAGSNGCIIRTTNAGSTWTKLNTGTTAGLNSIYFATSSIGVAVGQDGMILRTTDGGTTWNTIPSGTTNWLSKVIFINSTVGFIGGNKNLKTTDGGATWIDYAPGMDASLDFSFPGSQDGYIVGVTFYQTTDGGDNWEEKTNPNPGTPEHSYLSTYFTSSNEGYAGGPKGQIKKTYNGGNSWTLLTTLTDTNVWDICFIDNLIGYALTDAKEIYKTEDGGDSWDKESTIFSQSLREFFFTSDKVGYVAATNGVIYKNTSNGTPSPEIYVNYSLSSFSTTVGMPSAEQSFTVSGSTLTANIEINAPANFQISLSSGSGFGNSLTLVQSGGTVNATTIYIRYNPGVAGTHNGNVSLTSTGAITQNIPVSGATVVPGTPTIIYSANLNPFSTSVGNPSANQSFTVSGTDLSADISITAPANFEVSLSSGSGFGSSVNLVQSGGTVSSTTVYVRYNPAAAGSHNGNISLTSTGATTKYISVTGTAVAAPTINFSASLNTFFTEFGTPSSYQNFTVSGTGLTANIAITAPANFQVSLSSSSGYTTSLNLAHTSGSINSTTIYVRYNPAAAGIHSGDISLVSTGATTKNIPVNGESNIPGTEVIVTGSISPFSTIVGTPSFSRFFNVKGTQLTTDIIITAPANFELSLSPLSTSYNSSLIIPVGSTLANTKIYVRYNPSATGSHNGIITLASVNAITERISVFGVASSLTGIEENNFSQNISLYPNPNNGNMTLEYSIPSNGVFEIKDLIGRCVATYNFEAGNQKITINQQGLKPGIYFYQVNIQGNIIAKDKLIISQ